MGTVTYKNRTIAAESSETILDCLIRNGEKIPHSCKSGICQSCVMKTTVPVDDVAQKGLSPNKKEAGLFYSCQQVVNKDFEIMDATDASTNMAGTIIEQQRVSQSVVILKIRLESAFNYHAGQFVNLIRNDQLCRSYSLASVSDDQTLELHVRKVANGEMSNWLYEEDLADHPITVSGPIGECYLSSEMIEDDLILLGVGTGLAPLYGILKQALRQEFKGKVTLFHGGLRAESLYLVEELKKLEQQHPHFDYFPTYLLGDKTPGLFQADLVQLVKNHDFAVRNSTVMVCGDPEMVKKLKQAVFLKGVPSKKIYSDAFVSKK